MVSGFENPAYEYYNFTWIKGETVMSQSFGGILGIETISNPIKKPGF
jgi:hypothetical protein